MVPLLLHCGQLFCVVARGRVGGTVRGGGVSSLLAGKLACVVVPSGGRLGSYSLLDFGPATFHWGAQIRSLLLRGDLRDFSRRGTRPLLGVGFCRPMHATSIFSSVLEAPGSVPVSSGSFGGSTLPFSSCRVDTFRLVTRWLFVGTHFLPQGA